MFTQTGSMLRLLLGNFRLRNVEQTYMLLRKNIVLLSVNLEAVLLTAPFESESVGIAVLATHRLQTPRTQLIHAFPMDLGMEPTLMLLLWHLQNSGREGRRKPHWNVEELTLVEANVFPMFTLLPRLRTLLVMAPSVPKPPRLLTDPIDDYDVLKHPPSSDPPQTTLQSLIVHGTLIGPLLVPPSAWLPQSLASLLQTPELSTLVVQLS